MQTDEEKLKVREPEFLGRLSAAGEQEQMASTSAAAFVKRRSALEQEVAFLRDQLSAAVSTPMAGVESKLASVREDLAAANHSIGKLRAEVQTGRVQMDYKQQRASAHYSQTVDERLKAECSHRHEVLAWEKGDNNLK